MSDRHARPARRTRSDFPSRSAIGSKTLVLLMALLTTPAVAEPPRVSPDMAACLLVPVPREFRDTGRWTVLADPVIMIGDKLSGVEYWEKRVAALRASQLAAKRGKALNLYLGVDCSRLLTAAAVPPAGKLLSEALPTEWKAAEPFQGQDWEVKPIKPIEAAIAIYRPHAVSTPGDCAEIRTKVPLPHGAGQLVLDLFVVDTYERGTAGCRFMELWIDHNKVWETDLVGSRSGKEWVSVPITAAPGAASLDLRFRVVDRKPLNDATAVLVGRLRLRTRSY